MMAATQPPRPRGQKPGNRKPLNGLTRRGRSHSEAVRAAQTAERVAARRRKAWELFTVKELTFEQIAVQLDVSNRTAFMDVLAVRDHLLEGGYLDPESLRTKQQARLMHVVRKHLPKAGTKASAEIIIRASEREARLNGLDRQRETGYTVDQFVGVLRGVTALFLELVKDDALRRAFADGLRTKVGPALSQAIDVTPAPPAEEKAG